MNYKLIAYAQDFVSFLMEKLNDKSSKINQIILFGSIIRDEATDESDIDLFIDILDKTLENEINKIKEKFYESVKVKKYWSLFDIKNEIHCSMGNLSEWQDLKKSLIANGILLYGKYQGKLKTEPYYLFIISPSKNRNKNLSVWRVLYGYKQKTGKKIYYKQGLIKEYNGERLAKGAFIIPAMHAQKINSLIKKNKFKTKVIIIWKEK